VRAAVHSGRKNWSRGSSNITNNAWTMDLNLPLDVTRLQSDSGKERKRDAKKLKLS
jgi:hypothetical protein